jgi:peptidoglycan/LPS O-acetylase OafA/YrhL
MKILAARSRPSEIQGLQFVRANAVLLVVLCHAASVLGLAEYFDSVFLDGLFAKGAVGVDIFFVLSGFIIVHVSLKKSSLEATAGPLDFLLKRFVRIVPFLWVAVLAYAGIRYVGAQEFEWAPYFNSMFLFPVGEVRPNVVWSLRHEVLFYLVFAIAFLMRKRAPFLLYGWCASPVLVWMLTDVLRVPFPSNELLEFVFNRANALFGCGVLVGMLCKNYGEPRRLHKQWPWVMWILLVVATVGAFLVRDSASSAIVAAVATVTVVTGLLTPNSDTWFARTWELLGDASYSIYLTHNIVLLVGATVWVKVGGKSGYEIAIFVLGTLAVLGGVFVHLAVEKPVIAGTKSVIARLRRKTYVLENVR